MGQAAYKHKQVMESFDSISEWDIVTRNKNKIKEFLLKISHSVENRVSSTFIEENALILPVIIDELIRENKNNKAECERIRIYCDSHGLSRNELNVARKNFLLRLETQKEGK